MSVKKFFLLILFFLFNNFAMTVANADCLSQIKKYDHMLWPDTGRRDDPGANSWSACRIYFAVPVIAVMNRMQVMNRAMKSHIIYPI
jgi:hypothetical protein